MTRVTFNRFKAAKPPQPLLDHYLRLFDSKTIHFQPETLPGITSPSLFKSSKPLFLDLGCGVGDYTRQFASSHPKVNVVGIDLHFKSLYYAINQIHSSLHNLLFIRADISRILSLVPDHSIAGIFLLFPPPPTKLGLEKKHFFNPILVTEIHRCLAPGASFTLVSDNPDYLIQKSRLFNPNLFSSKKIKDTSIYFTRFHQKWLQKGITTQGNIFTKK